MGNMGRQYYRNNLLSVCYNERVAVVGVPAGRRGPDEGGRERLVGVPATGLGSAGFGLGAGYSIHSSIVYGNGVDSAAHPDSPGPCLASHKQLPVSGLRTTLDNTTFLRPAVIYSGSAFTYAAPAYHAGPQRASGARHDVVLRTERRHHPIAPVVVRRSIAVAHSNTGRMRRLNSTGRLRLHVPDRSEELQYVGRVDLRDRPVADAGEGVLFPCCASKSRVPPAARAPGVGASRAPMRRRGRTRPSCHRVRCQVLASHSQKMTCCF